MLAEVTPCDRVALFEIALPYLCEREIDPERVRDKLRLLAGLDAANGGACVWVPSARAIVTALRHDPEAGRALLVTVLSRGERDRAEAAAALLIVIAAPWCLDVLRAARTASLHGDLIDVALAWLGLGRGRCNATAGTKLQDEVEHWRWRLSETDRRALAELRPLEVVN